MGQAKRRRDQGLRSPEAVVMAAVVAAVDHDEVIEGIRAVEAERQALEVRLGSVIRQGRAAGMTWEDFGQAFGISRQAAHQRWARFEVQG